MRLFHGTTSKYRSRIEREGFHRFTWFALSEDKARDFANLATQRDGGREIDVWVAYFDDVVVAKDAWELVESYKFHKKPRPLSYHRVIVNKLPGDVR